MKFQHFSAAALAVASVVALGGCPVTSICSPTDTRCNNACVVGDTRPQCQTQVQTGTVAVRWTVNGQPAATACATANAANVRISIDGAAPVLEPCASGSRVFPSLTVGNHTVLADLINAAGTVLNNFPSTPVPVAAGGTTEVPIAFNVVDAQSGGVKFAWTVGGQAASTGCPAGSQVKFDSTAQPGAVVTQTYGCAQGTAQIDGLAAGMYTFTASLVNGATTTTVPNIAVTVVTAQVADVPSIDLPASSAGTTTGAAVLGWTINNGQNGANCPADSTMNVTVMGPSVPATAPSAACSAGTIRIADLAVGSYTFRLTLADPAHADDTSVTVEIPGVAVAAGADATAAPVNLSCTFCSM